MAGLKGRVEPGIVKGCSTVEPRGSLFGKYTDAEMLFQLKRIALDPCDPKVSYQKSGSLLKQALRVREFLSIGQTDCPRRKRKLDLYVKEKLLRHSSKPPLEVFDKHNGGEKSRRKVSHTSTVPCLLGAVESKFFDNKAIVTSHSPKSLLTFEDSLQERVFTESYLNVVDLGPPANYMSPVIDSDESVNGSDHFSPVKAPSPALNEVIHNSKSLAMKGTRIRRHQPPRKSIKLLDFIGDHLQKMVVPVGPRFQAEVPEWTELHGCGKAYSADDVSDDSRWLGTRVWPIETSNALVKLTSVGKGRSDSCSCQAPGSVECVRRHVYVERLLLQRSLGSAFYDWKFDEMGEQMLKALTLKDQKTLEPLLKMKQYSNGKNFLKYVLKFVPSEFRTTAINYYFNVFLPGRISMQTRLSSVELVDTDDEVDGSNYSQHLPDRCHSKSVKPGRSNDGKITQYLRLRT